MLKRLLRNGLRPGQLYRYHWRRMGHTTRGNYDTTPVAEDRTWLVPYRWWEITCVMVTLAKQCDIWMEKGWAPSDVYVSQVQNND
jgi:hypothetical protein